jgi:hypothetical protein
METYEEYHRVKPGDPITAKLANDAQRKIRQDIAEQVGHVQEKLDEYIETPVDAATFDGKSVENFLKELDERYAHQDHYHDGVRRYRRYFLEMETIVNDEFQPAVIQHNMKRQPLVQAYHLLDLPLPDDTIEEAHKDFKFCFCGPEHHEDPEAAEFRTKSWDERHWGDPVNEDMIDSLARERPAEEREAFKAQFKPDFTLNVWLSNLEKALFEPGPAQYHFDMGDVYRTQWVRDRQREKVSDLIDLGEWPARFVYRPLRLEAALVERSPTRNILRVVRIYHLNLNEVEIEPMRLGGNDVVEAHFMVLLRS